MEQKTDPTRERCPGEVPGLSVVQTRLARQLTSVFTRGLRSEHRQVLLDGIPINQGLQGAFNFGRIHHGGYRRIEVVARPHKHNLRTTCAAGVIQIFTKQGTGTPGVMFAAEGGSSTRFGNGLRATRRQVDGFDYSVGASRLDTENARPNNNYRNTAAISDGRLVA